MTYLLLLPFLDIDVAGRFYPDILENSTWFRNPAKPSEMDAQKVDPGETALGLTGLRPGDTVATSSEKWKGVSLFFTLHPISVFTLDYSSEPTYIHAHQGPSR